MALQIGDNFQYQGQKPNFVRDEFETLALMKAFPETSLNEGHLSFCKETSLVYKFLSTNTVDDSTGKWRIFEGVQSDMVRTIVVTESAPSKQDNILYFEYEPVSSVVLRSSAEKKIPRFSNAEIKNKFIKNNSGILNLILENPTDNTYKRVRILLRNNSKESGNLIIQDSDFNKVGTNTSYISSGSTGFTIEPNSILSIPINLLFDNDGLYEIQFDLVYLDSGNIITTNKFVVQVGN